jgi:hypothetical protein
MKSNREQSKVVRNRNVQSKVTNKGSNSVSLPVTLDDDSSICGISIGMVQKRSEYAPVCDTTIGISATDSRLSARWQHLYPLTAPAAVV